MDTSPSNYLESLDSMTFFFVNSGAFIGITASLFFCIGLLLGRLTWGRYKRYFRESDHAAQAYKSEIAQLKRRIAEQATRPIPSYSHPGTPLTLAPTPVPETFFPEGNMFCLWTEPEWTASEIQPEPVRVGEPFSLWTLPDFRPGLGWPPSRAFSLWTESSWAPTPRPTVAPVMARSFCIWTEEGWEPGKPAYSASSAFTLWTVDDYVPTTRTEKLAPHAGHSVWTSDDFVIPQWPAAPVPAAKPEGSTPTVAEIFSNSKSNTTRIPLPPGAGVPSRQEAPSGAVLASGAAASVKPVIGPVAGPKAVQVAKTQKLTPTPVKRPSFLGRAVAAAKAAIGLAPKEATPVPAPQAVPQIFNPPTQRKPILAGPPPIKFPRSQAFTIWTNPMWVAPTTKTAPVPLMDAAKPPVRAAKVLLPQPVIPQGSLSRTTSAVDGTFAPPIPAVVPPARAPVILETVLPAPITPVPQMEVSLPPVIPVTAIAPHVPAPTPQIVVSAPVPEAAQPTVPRVSTERIPVVVTAASNIEPVAADPSLAPLIAALQSRQRLGVAPPPQLPSGLRSHATMAFIGEILAGRVRNDFQLGIVYKAAPAEPDDLTELKGIAEVLMTRLNELGVYTFKQIALWTREQALEFSHRLGFKERVEREHWRDQARELHEQKYGVKI